MPLPSEQCSLDGRNTGSNEARRRAAQQIAIDLGLLRECPYHGQLHRASNVSEFLSNYCSYVSFDPRLSAFRGDAAELIDAVEFVAAEYGSACGHCESTG